LLSLSASAEGQARTCKPNLTCFLPDDYLEYQIFADTKLTWKKTYQFGAYYDQNQIAVEVQDENFDERAKIIEDRKAVSKSSSVINAYLSSGILGEEFVGSSIPYNYYVIQPSPVSIDKWLKHPTSSEYWKGKVTEENFIYNGKTRSVIVVRDGSIKQTIDKETGILLLLENTSQILPNKVTTKLTATNIIGNSNESKPTSQISSVPTPQKIPEWVKNIFKWYANDQISEQEVINALQFLIKQGIIKI